MISQAALVEGQHQHGRSSPFMMGNLLELQTSEKAGSGVGLLAKELCV